MDNVFHQPQGGNEMPRFGGRATMMRLPFIENLQGYRNLTAFRNALRTALYSYRIGNDSPVQHGHRRRAF